DRIAGGGAGPQGPAPFLVPRLVTLERRHLTGERSEDMQIPGGGIEPPEVARDRSWPRALRPFQFGQYRILILALTLSMLGGGMWVIAVFWQLAEIGASEYDYALILTVGTVGMLTFALLGG